MSNLGAYQWITTACKRVGGVKNFVLLTMASGAVIYKSGEVAVKHCVKKIKTIKSDKRLIEIDEKIYIVTSPGKSNDGLEFVLGDQFRVLETDGDAVLIEKIGDADNPYFVSAELLESISDYKNQKNGGPTNVKV